MLELPYRNNFMIVYPYWISGFPKAPKIEDIKIQNQFDEKSFSFLEFEILQIFLVKINWLFTEIKTNIAIWRKIHFFRIWYFTDFSRENQLVT